MARSTDRDAEDSFDRDLERDNVRRSGRELPAEPSAAERNREKGRWEHSPSDVTDIPQSDRPSQRYSNDFDDQDLGYTNPGTSDPGSTALEHKSELGWLGDWDDADLFRLRIYREPSILAGQVYFDLRNPEAGEFTPDEDMLLRGDELLVARNGVSDDVWDRLTGFQDVPEAPAA